MLKVIVGAALGFLLFNNPEARQVTADLLRAAGDAIAPAREDKTLQNRSLFLVPLISAQAEHTLRSDPLNRVQ